MDILQPQKLPVTFDAIVSNPPYVMDSEKKDMRKNVLAYEPAKALFVPDHDPLRFYQAIADFGQSALRQGGWIYVEINEQLGEETKKLFCESGYSHAEIKKDSYGKERMIRCQKR